MLNKWDEDRNIRFSDIFDYILLEPSRYIESKVSTQVKVKTLNMLINFFEYEESYMKCHKLLEIKNEILEDLEITLEEKTQLQKISK